MSSSSSSSQNKTALWVRDQAKRLYHTSHPASDIRNQYASTSQRNNSASTSQHHDFGGAEHLAPHTVVDSRGPQGRNADLPHSLERNHPHSFKDTAAEGVYQNLQLTRPAHSTLPHNVTITPHPDNVPAWSQEFGPNTADDADSSDSDKEEEYVPVQIEAYMLPCPQSHTFVRLQDSHRDTAQSVVGPNVSMPSFLWAYTKPIPVNASCIHQQFTGSTRPTSWTFHLDGDYLCPFCLEAVEGDLSGVEVHFLECGELKSYRIAGEAKQFTYEVWQL